MKFPIKPVVFASLLLLLQSGYSEAVEVTILYWGDRLARNRPQIEIEGEDTLKTGGAAVLSGMVKSIRGKDPRTLVLVGGGEFAGAPVASMSKGLSQVKILNKIGIDCFVPGNHEFAYGWMSLEEVMQKAEFPLILSNVIVRETLTPLFSPDTVFYLPDAVVGVVGLIYADFKRSLIRECVMEIETTNLRVAVRDFVERRRKTCDLLVALTYLGWELDSMLAEHVEGLDIIIGSRSHTPFDPPREVNGVIIANSGPYGRRLGRLIVEVDTLGDGVRSYRSDLLRIEPGMTPIDRKVKKLVEKLEKKYTKHLTEQIGVLQTDWNIAYDKPSNLAQFAADVMRSVVPSAHLSVINNRCLVKGLARGPLLERDIWEICPFDNPIVIFQITGTELMQIVNRQLTGSGEFMTWSGLVLEVKDGEIVRLTVNNIPVTDQDDYAVVTTGQMWDDIARFMGINREDRTSFHLPDANLRGLLIDAVNRMKVISIRLDDRWVVE